VPSRSLKFDFLFVAGIAPLYELLEGLRFFINVRPARTGGFPLSESDATTGWIGPSHPDRADSSRGVSSLLPGQVFLVSKDF